MISPERESEVRELLGRKLKHREISRRTGVDRRIVGQIARGTRPDYEALRRDREEARPRKLAEERRCGTCGGLLVIVPCVRCRTLREAGPRLFGLDCHDLPIVGLDLQPEHERRYLEVQKGSGVQDSGFRDGNGHSDGNV